jgi:FkbM family methyltransferase
MRGVHELHVCEALFRLAAPAETVVDVGANIGLMTSVLSMRVGSTGTVFSFEPHPATFERLRENVDLIGRAWVKCVRAAVSNASAKRILKEGPGFLLNDGTAQLVSSGDAAPSGACHEIEAVRLDEILSDVNCGVCKIDVEGHEIDTILGAERMLREGRIRDIVFESRSPLPAGLHSALRDSGFTIYRLRQRFWGIELGEVNASGIEEHQSVDYVATIQPSRARALVSGRGWKVLREHA